MKILYEEGPERVWMGAVEFSRGKAKEVEDGLAKQIMGKGTIKFTQLPPSPSLVKRGSEGAFEGEAGGLKTKKGGND